MPLTAEVIAGAFLATTLIAGIIAAAIDALFA